MGRLTQAEKLKKAKEAKTESSYLGILLNISLKQAEESKGYIRDLFLKQSMDLEDQIQKLGYSVKRNKPKTKKK